MRPFHHPPRPNRNQPHGARPGGDPRPPPFPAAPMHPGFPPPAPNPMAAAAAANPFLALQLMGQAQQLQNLGFLAAAALQQQHQQQPFFPGGFPPNPNQFAPYPGQHAGFNGGGAFQPGGSEFGGPRPPQPMMNPAGNGGGAFQPNGSEFRGARPPQPMMNPAGNGGGAFQPGGSGFCGPRPPRPMMNPAGNGCSNTVGSPPAPRPMLVAGLKDWNSSGGSNGEVKHFEHKADGVSDFSSESGGRSKVSDQKGRFNAGRDGRDDRQFGSSRGRGWGRNFNPGRGRGSNNWRGGNSNFMSHRSPPSGRCHDIPAPASGGHRKRPPIIYDAKEVKQWLEARKKNYPTSVNVDKKLSRSQSDEQNKDEEAQMRRQELKEVLAKQQELGFELPELPPGYLSETEDRGDERKSKWDTQRRGSRFGNRNSNTKRQRFDRGESRSKRPKLWNNNTRDDGAMPKRREPTLLQKLLSPDINRDRHRLLHTFKFMVMNNFFKDWPDKPLEFPSVTVNQVEIDNNIPTDDLDDLQNAEMIKDSGLDLKENGDGKDLTSIEGETDSVDHIEEEEIEDGATAESSDEDGNKSPSEEHCDEYEDDAA